MSENENEYWKGADRKKVLNLLDNGARVPDYEKQTGRDADEVYDLYTGDNFKIVVCEDGVELLEGDREDKNLQLMMEILKENRLNEILKSHNSFNVFSDDRVFLR